MTSATEYQYLTILFVEHVIEILGCEVDPFSLLTDVLTNVINWYVL